MTVWKSSGRVVVVGATVVFTGAAAWAGGGEPGEERPRTIPATRPIRTATAAIAGPGRGQRVSYMAPDAIAGPVPHSTQPAASPPLPASAWRNSERRILPVRVLGRSWTNSTLRG